MFEIKLAPRVSSKWVNDLKITIDSHIEPVQVKEITPDLKILKQWGEITITEISELKQIETKLSEVKQIEKKIPGIKPKSKRKKRK